MGSHLHGELEAVALPLTSSHHFFSGAKVATWSFVRTCDHLPVSDVQRAMLYHSARFAQEYPRVGSHRTCGIGGRGGHGTILKAGKAPFQHKAWI